MKRMIVGGICVVVLALNATGKQNYNQNCNQVTLNTCLISALNDTAKVKPGMTREDLMKLFDPSGGFMQSGKYVYKGSPYIKIDVEFSRATNGSTAETPKDVIKTVSRPYLATPIYD